MRMIGVPSLARSSAASIAGRVRRLRCMYCMWRQAEAIKSVGWRAARAAALGVALGVFACTTTPTSPKEHSALADVAAKVAQAAAAVTGQEAPIANAYEKGRYVGFDTHTYPGTRVMKA